MAPFSQELEPPSNPGRFTKNGNSYARKLLVEAAWSYS
jgi:hypothetical protein